MHVADDLVILEPADADGNVVPYGQPADRMLLTNLFNLAQPLIRYDLVDAVTMSDEPCPCGCAHRRITSVNGRINGAFEYESGAVVPRAAFEQTVLATPGVANFFVGKTQGGVDVSVVTDGSCDLPASADGTDRRAPPARRAGVGRRCARGRFASNDCRVGKVEAVRHQVI